jgi:hypothetical protein
LTLEIIKSAFHKTGLWPFNRDVISKEDMAPSMETLCEGHLPAATAPEVAMLAKLMQDMSVAGQISTAVATVLAEGEKSNDADAASVAVSNAVAMIGVIGNIKVPPMSSVSTKSSGSGHFANYNPKAAIQSIIDEMSTGGLAHLISTANLSSDTDLPPQSVGIISCHSQTSKSFNAKTLQEREILQALKESEERERTLLRRVYELQATNILNNLYCVKIWGQLAHHEKKKRGKNRWEG